MAEPLILNARGVVFKDIHDRACEHYKNGQIGESERLCRFLLDQADLSDFHKARCHMVLGQSKDNYLWHAEQAVETLENLYVVRPGSSYSGKQPPNEEQLQVQARLLSAAKDLLAVAQEDYAKNRTDFEHQFQEFREYYGREPTKEELVKADWDAHCQEAQTYLDDCTEFQQEFLQGSKQQPLEQFDDEDEDDEEAFPWVAPEPHDSQQMMSSPPESLHSLESSGQDA